MIPRKPTSEHTLRWKKEFAASVFGQQALTEVLPQLDISIEDLRKIDKIFPIQIPSRLIAQNLGKRQQALLRQYLPNSQELIDSQDDSNDPVGDINATQISGVIKKYAHRVLLVASSTCPVHCRYCFRKNYPYPKDNPNTHQFEDALNFCRNDETINEVILSGGDPLSLEDELLEYLFNSFNNIAHIKTIRLHTKFPSMIPKRVTPHFLSVLTNSNLNKVCVFHINHPDEINAEFCDAVLAIKNTDTVTLNQSVLLSGVNDSAEILIELSHELFNAGILPYYLHRLDHAKGTRHFRVSSEKTAHIMQQLKYQLPGYLVPKLATEIAGHASKLY